MCGGSGSIAGALVAAALAPATGGASLALYAAAGAAAGDALVDKPAAAQADALKQQKIQSGLALDAAKAQADQADQANNRMNQKSPDSASMLSQSQIAAKAAAGGSTMLTSPMGVDPQGMNLGKNNLLGAA